jgi:hypothetical protein
LISTRSWPAINNLTPNSRTPPAAKKTGRGATSTPPPPTQTQPPAFLFWYQKKRGGRDRVELDSGIIQTPSLSASFWEEQREKKK